MITFHDWLRAELNRKPDLNQSALAIHLGLAQSTISSWLRGLYVPNPDNCRKLAHFFDVPEDEVLIAADHRQLIIVGHNRLGEPRPTYHIGPRARLDNLLDNFTEGQIEALITFLNKIK